MNNWMQNFAYRTGMQWWIFILSAGMTFVIALGTVIIKALKAALTNSADSLRTE
jgi:putative ABC transport system permease protein